MRRIGFFLLFLSCYGVMAADRYEAENAIPAEDHKVVTVTEASASNGAYVQMKDGDLSFSVTMATEGFYILYLYYQQANDSKGKIQNLAVNGTLVGQISFPYAKGFTVLKAASKVKLSAGSNTIEIKNSWGWVDIDYMEIDTYTATPFNISGSLVTPNACGNAQKVYGFLRENFGKHVVSGVMTNEVMLTNGNYTPMDHSNQPEIVYIKNASGKIPALIGFDFIHGTGLNSDQQWHQGYTKATMEMAKNQFLAGGIPTYSWHWKDPSKTVEAFYSPSSGNTPDVEFNLNKAFVDSNTYAAWDESSAEYIAILADLDTMARYLKELQADSIPILWRPLHEAAGRWFWWGYRGAGAESALYSLMFDRLVNHHHINNLIWVWTTDEASDALEWYPGDDKVDIIGRDYYYYPREANHASLVASFEKVKDLYNASKIIALSENGSVPYPDSMQADGAHWSWFMPWYGDYTWESWANDNVAADWNIVMNHDFVLTLDEMPGWDNYSPSPVSTHSPASLEAPLVQLKEGQLNLSLPMSSQVSLRLLAVDGSQAVQVYQGHLDAGEWHWACPAVHSGIYIAYLQVGRQSFPQKIWIP